MPGRRSYWTHRRDCSSQNRHVYRWFAARSPWYSIGSLDPTASDLCAASSSPIGRIMEPICAPSLNPDHRAGLFSAWLTGR
jgi:hypothetical protein